MLKHIIYTKNGRFYAKIGKIKDIHISGAFIAIEFENSPLLCVKAGDVVIFSPPKLFEANSHILMDSNLREYVTDYILAPEFYEHFKPHLSDKNYHMFEHITISHKNKPINSECAKYVKI